MGKISLKKVEVHEALSEETLCFSAELYEDGKLMAYVSNRGHGGSNNITPAEGLKYEDVKHLDTIDAECEILTMAEDINIARKYQTKALVIAKDMIVKTVEFKHSIAKLKKAGHLNKIMETAKKYEDEGYRILNTNL